MQHKNSDNRLQKLFSVKMLLLCVVGLLLNLALSKLVLYFNLPLYLDNVGSILVAALGGALPGMAVGFFSNVIGSVSEPISMYYGILTMVIAFHAAEFSKKGLLKKWSGWLRASLCFVFVGGGIGSVMTWFLYGGGLGGIAKPYAEFFYAHGFNAFFAQLTADLLLDIPDKLLSVGLVCLLLRFYPRRMASWFPLSFLYDRKAESKSNASEPLYLLRHSVNKRIITVLTVSVMVTGLVSVTIGTLYHHQRLVTSYETAAQLNANQAAELIDGDSVEAFLSAGTKAPGYAETKKNLQTLFDRSGQITYLYVYSVQADGCHVVFDLDTPETAGNVTGTVVPLEQYFYDNKALFLAGKDVPPEFTRGQYGALITAYATIHDSTGKTVAYAGTDISVESYVLDLLTYIIQVVSIIFGVALLIFSFSLFYIDRHVTSPIKAIVAHSNALDQISPEGWLDSDAWKNRQAINTGDEIEELYSTICKVEKNVSLNVQKLIQTEQQLVQTKELKRINQELEKTIRKADEANQAKTDFLSRMSHDIRTPLNAILGTAALAKDELNDPAAMAEAMNTISTSGQFLLGLINDILDINKIENGKLELKTEPYQVDEFIASVEKTIRPLAEKKNLTFRFEMNCGHGLIYTDKLRYQQIFFNLLSNAIKYSPEGGLVEFLAEPLPAPPGIAGVRNIVRDHGIGMSEDYIKHLYEPFSRDSQAAINQIEGSGLGLAIVKSIVDSMGGTISVRSALGKGTEFIVDLYLPTTPPAASDTGAVAAVQTGEIRPGIRILLVEDNAINIRIAEKLLTRKGCVVTVAENGQKALALFSSSPEGTFDLILMDIRMPVMDGLTATKKLRLLDRTDAKTIPVIAMTANAYAEDIRSSLAAGMNDHLAKPIEPEKLYATIAAFQPPAEKES